MNKHIPCPLCENEKSNHIFQEKKRSYRQCHQCDLIFVPSTEHINHKEEKSTYDLHENAPSQQGYRNFLNNLIIPLKKELEPGMTGLDFGSGPGPTLHLMLAQGGYPMQTYDPFYANTPELLESEYDFVTSTEVIEHFSNPNKSWEILISCVKNQGLLGLMTLRHENIDFTKWWYKNDPTHVSFYSLNTFKWIAQKYKLQFKYVDERVIIYSKSTT